MHLDVEAPLRQFFSKSGPLFSASTVTSSWVDDRMEDAIFRRGKLYIAGLKVNVQSSILWLSSNVQSKAS